MEGNSLFFIAITFSFMVIVVLGLALTGEFKSSSKSARLKVAKRSSVQNVQREKKTDKRKRITDTLKEVEDRKLAASKKKITLGARIEQAGLSLTVTQFWIFSLIIGIIVALVVFFFTFKALYAVAACFVVGLGLPRWILSFLKSQRLKKFSNYFPDALDVIVRGIKSGLPLIECFNVIASETQEPIRSEFKVLMDGISIGVDVADGLKKMETRVPLPELNFFSVVIAIQAKTGGNLSEALNNLSGVIRSRKMLKERIGALSAEAKASAYIIGAMPPGVLVLLSVTSPNYVEPLFNTNVGNLIMVGGLMCMGIGILVMNKMISFKM